MYKRQGGTVPPPLPAWDQLPSCSQRKNPSRPCSSAGTNQWARVPPPEARHSAAPHASLPVHRTPKALSPRGPVPLQPQLLRSRARLLLLLGFKLKFPDWGRQSTRHAGPAPSKRKPLPGPRRTRPPHENPSGLSTPPPPRPGHAPEAVPAPLPAGFPEIRRRVPQAGRTADPQSCQG